MVASLDNAFVVPESLLTREELVTNLTMEHILILNLTFLDPDRLD